MASYEVQLSNHAKKAIQKMDGYQARIIMAWIKKNLVGCSDPRLHGKALIGDKHNYWRYRVGNYRIIADIQDSQLRIELIEIVHRRNV